MRELRESFLKNGLGRFILTVFSWLYAFALSIRSLWYGLTGHHPKALPSGSHVISVGNLTAGGTGKTSMVSYLTRYFLDKGSQVCVISRGYKGGDEARMMEAKFGSASRFNMRLNSNRYEAAREFLAQKGPAVFILDDAHQHFSLKKDHSLVLINCMEGKDSEKLLPLGLLREPVKRGLRRASAVILTYADLAAQTAADWREKIKNLHPNLPVFETAHEPDGFSGSLGAQALQVKGKSVVLVSGIGKPEAFEETIRHKLGAQVLRHFVFEDHHAYQVSEWNEIMRFALQSHAYAVLTTAKDWVRLPEGFNAQSSPVSAAYVRIRMNFLNNEPEFLKLLETSCAA